MGWVKVLLQGDAAELTTNSPASVGVTVSSGTAAAAARYDHVHNLAAGCISASNLFVSSVVDNAAMADSAIAAAEINTAVTDIRFSQITLIPKATGTSLTVGGTLFYDSDDAHPYVYQV